jgi:hypothetical protein
LFEESIEKCLKAVELKADYPWAFYNLACSCSLLDKKEDAFEWLEKYLKNPISRFNRNYIENDSDLNPIKEDSRMKELLDKYLPEK